MDPRATYDRAARVLTIELAEGTVAGTMQYPDAEHLIDLDDASHVLSIEILAPGEIKLDEIAARFALDDQLEAIQQAVAAAIRPTTGVKFTVGMQHINGTVRSPTTLNGTYRSRSGPARQAPEIDLEPA